MWKEALEIASSRSPIKTSYCVGVDEGWKLEVSWKSGRSQEEVVVLREGALTKVEKEPGYGLSDLIL